MTPMILVKLNRLRADEIPLLSRMISVADAFEVMTSNRVYRTKCTKEEAFQALREGAGTQFDSAAVVDTFIKINADEGVIQ